MENCPGNEQLKKFGRSRSFEKPSQNSSLFFGKTFLYRIPHGLQSSPPPPTVLRSALLIVSNRAHALIGVYISPNIVFMRARTVARITYHC